MKKVCQVTGNNDKKSTKSFKVMKPAIAKENSRMGICQDQPC